MLKFIVSILCISVFFIGLGTMVEKVGASLKSDEKALALIGQARQAIGGDQAIAEIRGMVIKGSTTHSITVNGSEVTKSGETEIVMQLPNMLMRSVRIGHAGEAGKEQISRLEGAVTTTGSEGAPVLVGSDGEPVNGKRMMVKKVVTSGAEGEFEIKAENGEFVTEDGKKIIVKRTDDAAGNKVIVRTKDGNTEVATLNGETMNLDGGKAFRVKRAESPLVKPELLRTTLGLLLSAPEGLDVSYKFAGEGDVDGLPANIIDAEVAGSVIKLYLSKSTNLPLMISYKAPSMGHMIRVRKDAGDPAIHEKDVVVFAREMDSAEGALVQHEVRFSDYRSTGGVQLPYRWETSVGGKSTEVFNVASYELNPADIAERCTKNKARLQRKVQN